MRADEEVISGSRDTLALSFLDVLSCGLGGAIYLFLIFSVLPHLGTPGASPLRGVSGFDVRSQSGGIRLENLKDRVRSASIQIEARFEPALPPRTRLRWMGLPRKHFLIAEQDTAGNVLSLSALVDRGIEPDDTITLLWPESISEARPTATVTVFVGGYTENPVTIPPPTEPPASDGRLNRLCRVVFGADKLEVIP